ncbi:hypothetical protein HRG_010339 [Hirsutella rhossiliensis]|uniref:Uncharacterized protein n=1 Tax=Hirsutella rhossiliensis TaxID=111463 RepID=A0A9P8MNS5_9HYPO|nr:uncharacterized protein HRG_10339 [Hirsutella rhossiliensis]KAH0958652.1 hypothetical protein HRG_10339 [Hirsutella rhossiliensis]
MAPPPPLTGPMSKAHRILGSMPLSIDSPPSNRDDASSSALSDDRSVTTATSYDPDSEAGDFFDDHPVGIAKSDNGWGDESGVLPHSHHLADRSDDAAGTITSSILRKSRSSSTIKSWYDKSKLPLSISQQTSSSAMAKGPPVKTDSMLDLDFHSLSSPDVRTKSKSKKKPTKLDLSSLMSGPRLIRKVSQRQLGGGGQLALALDCTTKYPATLSPITPMDSISHQRPSPDGSKLAPPAFPASRPDATRGLSGNQWPRTNDALSALPTLYDHYEQMSMRHVMKQYSQPDMSQPKAGPRAARSFSRAEWQLARRSSKCFDWVHDSLPPTPQTAFHTKYTETSPPPATSTTSVSSRHTRTSKTTDKSFGSADLQQTSVLVLSDSEGDDIIDDISPATPAPARRLPTLENDVPPLVASRSRPSQKQSKGFEKPPSKSIKRASFAPADTYITTPKAKERDDPDEARQQMLDWNESLHRLSIASSTDQLTPPLSPTSVDFYIRSARSSIDGPGSHNRLMAVSRQEELLLSALRQKQKAMRGSALTDLREGNEEHDGKEGERRSRDQRPKVSQTSSAELTMIDLDLPALRLSTNDAGNSFERQSDTSRAFHRRWSATAAVPGGGSKRFSQGSSCEHMGEEVPFILDDADPSPDLSDYRDWHAAMTAGTTPAGKPSSRRDLFGSQSRCQRRGSAQSSSGCSPTQLHPDSFARLSGVAEETAGDAEEEADIPRPDSPISPESFPAVPHGRAAGCNLVRLSAVGSSLLAGDMTHP